MQTAASHTATELAFDLSDQERAALAAGASRLAALRQPLVRGADLVLVDAGSDTATDSGKLTHMSPNRVRIDWAGAGYSCPKGSK